MKDLKGYLESRSIWANIIGLAALALDFLGLASIAAEEQSQIVDAILKIVEAGGFLAGVVFRAVATKRLGLPLIGQ